MIVKKMQIGLENQLTEEFGGRKQELVNSLVNYWQDPQKQDKKNDKESRQPDQELPESSQNTHNHNQIMTSPYINEYNRQLVRNRTVKPLEYYSNKFTALGIVLQREGKIPQSIYFRFSNKSKTYKIIEYEVFTSYFLLKINILNLTDQDELKINLNKRFGTGVFGSVYEVKIDNKLTAVKEILLGRSPQKTINNVINEYVLMKICAALQIGPPVNKIYGFDIIKTNEHIYFCCQKGISFYDFVKTCETPEKFTKAFEKLEESMLLLHKNSFTHNDIKPDNIVYSPTLKSLVFIDYGLTTSNVQHLGLMKVETAKGSISYCCNEMKQLFLSLKSSGYVDMYYNDYYGLKKTKLQALSSFQIKILQIKKNQLKQYTDDNYVEFFKNRFEEQKNVQKFQDHQRNHDNKRKPKFESFENNITQNTNVQLIYFVYLIYFNKLSKIKQFFQEKQENLSLLDVNFNKIYFVFFEVEVSFQLYTIYKEILAVFSNNKYSFSFEAKQVFTKFLQPYFKIYTDQESLQYGSHQKAFESYILKNKSAHEYLQFVYQFKQLNQIRNYQMESLKHLQKVEIELHSEDQICLVVEKLFKRVFQMKKSLYLLNFIEDIFSKLQNSIKWYDMTPDKIEKLESFCKGFNIHIKIKFIIKMQNPIMSKFLIYSKILSHVLLKLISCFHLLKVAGSRLVLIYEKNSQCRQNIFTVLNNIYIYLFLNASTTNLSYHKKIQSQKKENQQISKSNDIQKDVIQFFSDTSNAQILIFQTSINVINLLNRFYSLNSPSQDSLKIKQDLIVIIEQNIHQTFLCGKIFEIEGKNKTDLLYDVQQFWEFFGLKLFEIRKRLIRSIIGKFEQSYDLFGMIQFRQKFVSLQRLLTFCGADLQVQNHNIKISSTTQKQRISNQNSVKKIKGKYLKDMQMDAEFYKTVICQLALPHSLLKKYKLSDKYKHLLQKINTTYGFIQQTEQLKIYFLSKILTINIEGDEIQNSIQIIKYLEINNMLLLDENFIFICLRFFTKIHNSKQVNKYRQRVQCFNYSNLTENVNNFASVQRQIHTVLDQVRIYNPLTKISSEFSCKQSLNSNFSECKSRIKDYEIKWNAIKNSFLDEKKSIFRLFTFRSFIKMVITSPNFQIQLTNRYLQKYELEVDEVVRQIQQKYQKLRENTSITKQISEYLDVKENQHDIWTIIQTQSIFLTRSQLIMDLLLYNYPCRSGYIDAIVSQWQKFDKIVKKLYQNDFKKVPNFFFQLQCQYRQLAYEYEEFWTQSKRKLKKKCEASIEICFQKLSNLQSQGSFFKEKQTKNSLKKTKKTTSKVQHGSRMFDLQIYIGILLYVYLGHVELSSNTVFMITDKKSKSQDIKESSMKKLKYLFYYMSAKNDIEKIFTFNISYIRWLWVLVRAGCQTIVKGRKSTSLYFSQQSQKVLQFQHDPHYFLTFFFANILVFEHKYSCTSYSNMILKLFREFKVRLTKEVMKVLKNKPIERIIDKINDFQTEIENYVIYSDNISKLIEGHIIILHCQSIKANNILKSLFQKQLTEKQKVIIRSSIEDTMNHLLRICIQTQNMEPFLKEYVRHEVIKLLIEIKELNSMMTDLEHDQPIHEEKLLQPFNRSKSVRVARKIQYLYLRLFRYSRRGCAVYGEGQQDIVDLDNVDRYHESYSPLSSATIKKISQNFSRHLNKPSNGPFKLSQIDQQKVKSVFEKKIASFIKVIQ